MISSDGLGLMWFSTVMVSGYNCGGGSSGGFDNDSGDR